MSVHRRWSLTLEMTASARVELLGLPVSGLWETRRTHLKTSSVFSSRSSAFVIIRCEVDGSRAVMNAPGRTAFCTKSATSRLGDPKGFKATREVVAMADMPATSLSSLL